jgi:hypothetical protein
MLFIDRSHILKRYMADTTAASGDIQFEISFDHFSHFKFLKPYSDSWNEMCNKLELNSAERIFYALCKSTEMNSHVYKPSQLICTQGAPVSHAHVVIGGYVELVTRQHTMRVGPGAVFGLAEGIMTLPHLYTVRATEVVTTSAIPMAKVLKEWPQMHKGLRGIERCTVMRVLGESAQTKGSVA